ncbi:WD repeat-containing protein, partial [Musa troglodytarum]
NIVAAFLLVNNEFSIKRQTVIKCWRRRDYYPISSIPPRPPPRRCSAAAAFPSLADDLFPRWLPSPPSPVRSLLLLGPNREPVNLTPIPIAADRRVGFRRILDFPSRDFSASGRFHRFLKGFMDNMQYAEELLREFLVFRGFTNTLQSFEKELATDIGRNFQVDKILDLVFSMYVPNYQADKLIALLNFFKQRFSSSSETVFISTLSKLEVSILRYYIVNALQSAKHEKVVEFFQANGSYLLQKREDWTPWFAIPYIKNPSLDPQFRVYFSKEWFDALHLSFRNFLSEISTEKNTVKYLKDGIKQLNNKLSQLQALLETKEAEILYLQSLAPSDREASILKEINSISDLSSEASSKDDGVSSRVKDFREPVNDSLHIGEKITTTNCGIFKFNWRSRQIHCGQVQFYGRKLSWGILVGCRFSASGMNIASASVDGTVRIWTYDSSTPTSRNATIYCGAEIMSLDWECRSDRLGQLMEALKLGMLMLSESYVILAQQQDFQGMAFISLTKRLCFFDCLEYENMEGHVLPLGEDPPAITSLCFNHNGKILAASAADGMIHMFDMSAGLQITGWPAHDTAVSSLLFGPDETSIFSLGSDGKIFEWSLQNQGRVLWSRDCTRYCFPDSLKICRHEIALDSNGKRLLVTSGSVRSPIYQVQGHTLGLRTLPHSGAITSVDWHPTLPIFITGSADHSVRVTSII